MMRSRWTRFWFEIQPTHILALLRIFVGLTLLQKLTKFHSFSSTFSRKVYLPRFSFNKVSKYYIEEFRLPVPGFEWLPVPSITVYRGIEFALLILAICFVIGLFTRVVGPLIAVLWAYLFLLSQFNYAHHVFTFVLTFLILGFSRCGEHYSLDAYLFGAGKPIRRRPITPLRMIQVLVSVIYLFGALTKFQSGWLNGGFIEHMAQSGRMNGALADVAPFIGFGVLGSATVIIESLLAFGFWFPRLRTLCIWLGIGLHVGIDSMMDVSTFSTQMMALYIAFIDPIPGRRVVLYDGSCRLCVRCRRFINLFDWFRRFTWLDFRDSHVMAQVHFVTAEHLEREMVVIDKAGQLHSGFKGWRAILSRLPLSFPFVWPLYFPVITALGARLYRTVSAHRFAPKRCGDGSCQLEGPAITPPAGPWCETLNLANERAGGESGLPHST